MCACVYVRMRVCVHACVIGVYHDHVLCGGEGRMGKEFRVHLWV